MATLATVLPYKLDLMPGGLAGIITGLALQEWKRRKAAVAGDVAMSAIRNHA